MCAAPFRRRRVDLEWRRFQGGWRVARLLTRSKVSAGRAPGMTLGRLRASPKLNDAAYT